MKNNHSQLLDNLKNTADEQERSAILMKFSLDQLKKALKIAVQTAAVVHYFDHEILNTLLDAPLKADEFEQLISLSYIEIFPGHGYNVHKSSRKTILNQLWIDSPDNYKKFSLRAFNLFNEKASENRFLYIEAIYHQLIIDTEQGIKSLEKFFDELVGRQYYNLDKAEVLLRVVSEHGEEKRLTGKFVDSLSWLQEILEMVDKDDAGYRNPYKHLNYYDDNDGKNIYGRKKETKHIVEDLEKRFDNPEIPTVVRIEGASGTGKSSFLRAGVIYHLFNETETVQYVCLTVRPEEFTGSSGKLLPVIETLLNLINKKTAIELAPNKIADVINSSNPVSTSIELLTQHLGETRLVIGIDQFEEILDVLIGGLVENNWQLLIDFINCTIEKPNIGIVYTLESSRKPSHDKQKIGKAFEFAGEIELNNDAEFVKKIISLPFRKAGYELDKDIIEELSNKFENYQLPLLALKLSYLFDEIKEQYLPDFDNAKASSQFNKENIAQQQEKNDQNYRTIKAKNLNLCFDDIIEKQAEKAWVRGGQKWPIKEEDEQMELDCFLQPFISVNNNQIQLNAVPRNSPYSLEQKLATNFFRERLLVFVSNNQMRLVHEAVIKNWPAANSWFEKRTPYLKMEARFRILAQKTNGKPDLTDRSSERLINEAAEILDTYLRSWSWKKIEISEENKILRDYCLTLFHGSQTPDMLIKTISERKGTHVTLAACYGLVDLLEKFRASDHEWLNRPNTHNQGKTPLYRAAWSHEATVSYLLDHIVDPIGKTTLGWPAISGAIQSNEMEIFLKLLEKTKDKTEELETELGCPDESTLLHLCAQENKKEMAKILVEDYGFDPKAEDKYKRQPLHFAAMSGAEKTFAYFKTLSSLDSQMSGKINCLHLSAINGHKAILEAILKEKEAKEILITVDENDNTALHLAAENRKTECVKYLLNYIENPNLKNKQERVPIHLVIGYLNEKSSIVDQDDALETLKVLLSDKRIDPNIKNGDKHSPLFLAKGLPKIQKLLLTDARLELKEPIEEGGETPFSIAAGLGLWPVCLSYVNQYGVPNEPNLDGKGNSFLHILAYENSPLDLLDNLLDDVKDNVLNAHNSKGQTPIVLAIKNKNWPVVERLLDTGRADLKRDKLEIHTSLFLALEMKANGELIEKLITTYPESLLEEDIMGWTVLHQVCRHQQQKWLDILTPFIEESPQLLEQADRMGRTPAYLLNSHSWDKLPISREHIDWPDAKSWDQDLFWETLEKKERDVLINQINDIDKKFKVTGSIKVVSCKLSFYAKEVSLLRLVQADWKPKNVEIYFLSLGDKLFRLNGTSHPIHEINSKNNQGHLVLQINQDTVLDYFRFFCFFVRGDEGPFTILESLNQKEVPIELNDKGKDTLLKFAHPSWYNGWDETNKVFYVSASVYYSNAIFETEFEIKPTGMIEMLDDTPVAEDLSASVNKPIIFE